MSQVKISDTTMKTEGPCALNKTQRSTLPPPSPHPPQKRQENEAQNNELPSWDTWTPSSGAWASNTCLSLPFLEISRTTALPLSNPKAGLLKPRRPVT